MQGFGRGIEADPNTDVLYPNRSIPAVAYRIEKGKKVTAVRTFVRWQIQAGGCLSMPFDYHGIPVAISERKLI